MTEAKTLYVAQNMDQPELTSRLGGSVVVVSTRCPGKTSDNEDAAAVVQCDDRNGVFVVADGMGGGAGGEQASKIAVESIHQEVCRLSNGEASLRAAILNGIEVANEKILGLGIGAASTLAALEIQDRVIRPYHVGDSSILVVGQRGKVKLQTVAHSPVGLAVEAGVLDDDAAMNHAERHLVTNILGTSTMRIEIGSNIKLARFDTVLLATDGVFDNVTIDEIVNHIRKGPLLKGVTALYHKVQSRMNQPVENCPSKPDDATLIAYRMSSNKARS